MATMHPLINSNTRSLNIQTCVTTVSFMSPRCALSRCCEVIYWCLAGLRFRGDDVKSSPEVTMLFCLIGYILKYFLFGPKSAQNTLLLHRKTNAYGIHTDQAEFCDFIGIWHLLIAVEKQSFITPPPISACFFRLKLFQLKLVSLVSNYCHLC